MAILPVISLRNISKSKGVFHLRKLLLEDVNFDIYQLDQYAVLGGREGASAALLSIMAGTSRPSSGRVAKTGIVSMPLSTLTQIAPYKTGRELATFLSRLYQADAGEVLEAAQQLSGFTAELVGAPISSFTTVERVQWSLSLGYSLPADIYLFYGDIQYGSEDFRKRCREAYAIRSQTSGSLIATSNPTVASDLGRKGCVLHNNRLYPFDDIDDAVKMYHRTMIATNDNSHLHVRSLVKMGEARQAEHYLRSLGTRANNSVDTQLTLAELAFRDGRHTEALQAAELALRLGGLSDRVSVLIVKVKEANGDYSGAVQHIEQVSAETGVIPLTLQPMLALNLERVGEKRKAGLMWKDMAVRTGSPVAFRRSQIILTALEEWAELNELADYGLRTRPNDIKLLEIRFQALVGQQKWDEATKLVQRVEALDSLRAVTQIYNLTRSDQWTAVVQMLRVLPQASLRAQRSERVTMLLAKAVGRRASEARKAGKIEDAEELESTLHILTLEIEQ